MASLKKKARMSNSDSEQSKEVEADSVLELSVTVSYLGADVKKEELDNLHLLIREHCVSGLAALERGDTENHLHFQMVVRAITTSAKSFGILVRKYMNWFGVRNMNPVGKVTCKVLTNRFIHTFKGMIGYYLKDSGSEHFASCLFNISDDDVVTGKTLHAIYGKADLKRCVILTNKNVCERMYVWHKYRSDRKLTATFLSTLTDMIQSGMFVPAATWIIPLSGQGMDHKRMTALFRCISDPCNSSKQDVQDIFVKKRQFVKGRYYDEEDVILDAECANTVEADVNPPPASSPESDPTTPTQPIRSGVKVACMSREALQKTTFPVPFLRELGSTVKLERKEVANLSSFGKAFCGKRRPFEDASVVQPVHKTVSFVDELGDYLPLKDPVPMVTSDFLETTNSLAAVGAASPLKFDPAASPLKFDPTKVKLETGIAHAHSRVFNHAGMRLNEDKQRQVDIIELSSNSEEDCQVLETRLPTRKYVDKYGKPMVPPVFNICSYVKRKNLMTVHPGFRQDMIDSNDYFEWVDWKRSQRKWK